MDSSELKGRALDALKTLYGMERDTNPHIGAEALSFKVADYTDAQAQRIELLEGILRRTLRFCRTEYNILCPYCEAYVPLDKVETLKKESQPFPHLKNCYMAEFGGYMGWEYEPPEKILSELREGK